MTKVLRALKDERWNLLGFGTAGFAIALLQAVAFHRLAGASDAARKAFGYALSLEATANAALFATPPRLDTVGGYLELRAFAPLAILFAAWALVSATGRGSPSIVARAAGFTVAVAIAAAAACLGVLAGVASTGETVSAGGVLEAGLLLTALASACFGICVAVAQVSPAATRIAGVVLLTMFFLNSLSRIFAQLGAPAWLSPFRYYDLSAPIPPGGHLDFAGLVALTAIAVGGTGLATVLSRRHTHEATAPSRPTFGATHVPLLMWPVTRILYPERFAYALWCAGFAVLGIVLVAGARASMQDILALPRTLPGLPQFLFVFYAQTLDQTWFEAALLLLVALVFAFVASWAAQDRDGRLEAQLTEPYSRSAVVLERLGAVAGVAAILTLVSGLCVALTSVVAGLTLDMAHLAIAGLVLVVFSVVLGAAGTLLTSWIPRAAPILFGGFALACFLDDQIGVALGLPGWLQAVSPFRLVGAPLAAGLDAKNLALMLLLAAVGLGSSILAMHRRDVGA